MRIQHRVGTKAQYCTHILRKPLRHDTLPRARTAIRYASGVSPPYRAGFRSFYACSVSIVIEPFSINVLTKSLHCSLDEESCSEYCELATEYASSAAS